MNIIPVFSVTRFRSLVPYLLLAVLASCNGPENKDEADGRWRAPESAAAVENPFEKDSLIVQKGQALYEVYCRSCHGGTGLGDGAAGGALGQKPANFHDRRVRNQSIGSMFYKVTTGRGNMPSFKDVLSEEQRWQVVSYIRRMSLTRTPSSPPKSLRPDITVKHVMTVGPKAVRILQHPLTNELWYTSFDGDVFRIRNLDSAAPSAEKIIALKDHGITRLQGAAFLDNKLFLCGNVDGEDKKVTRGRLVRFDLTDIHAPKMDTVFNTIIYPTNKTTFDHGWNALEISPDKKYIFVNSGARTDHGEVQDNGGAFPNARDNALTSKIFRFPVGATNLLLTDDLPKLKADSLVFSEGVRNAYDMAFDGSGNLFAVSNSPDYDMPEDMFWLRQGHHYGFPWVMGGIENPQQYPDWKFDPATDSFLNKGAHSWQMRYFHTDTGFRKIPAGVHFTEGVQNLGPDANEYRGHTGKVLDGDITGVPTSTFTPHCSPLGLFFDKKGVLSADLKNHGFVMRYSLGKNSSLMRPFTNDGADLLDLTMMYNPATDNYFIKTKRIVTGFEEPTDAVMIGNDVYIIEYNGVEGNLWKLTMPKN